MLDRTEPLSDAPAGVAREQLRSFIERIERLREKKTIESDIKDVFAEAKGNGYDTDALKVILRERAADPDKKAELDAIVELYRRALACAWRATRERHHSPRSRTCRKTPKSKIRANDTYRSIVRVLEEFGIEAP